MASQSVFAPIGNTDLLNRDKTAFLCSSAIPERTVAEVMKWVDSLSPETDCVICGQLQRLEQQVLCRLLERKIPTILVLSTPYPTMWPTNMLLAVGNDALLIVTVVDFDLPWLDKYDKALARNQYMLSNAQRVVVGYCTPGGKLSAQVAKLQDVTFLTECKPEDAIEIQQRRRG